MWERKQLKERAKEVFKANYWKCVVAALVLGITIGGGSASNANGAKDALDKDSQQQIQQVADALIEHKGLIGDSQKEAEFEEDVNDLAQILKTEGINLTEDEAAAAGVVVLIAFVGIVAVSVAIALFLINPLQVGCRGFFIKNLTEQATLGELVSGFQSNYMRNVNAGFRKDLSIMLWSFLFVIPGIVKAYEYRMVSYLLAEDNDMTAAEVLKKSREMMKGQKWNAFVLDLSFIGWELLSIMTCGIVGFAYVDPYKAQTDAALYDELKNVAA